MRLPEELATRLRGGAAGTLTAYLTSSSRDGRTNTLASPFTDVVDGELVLMPDLFAQKTKVNLNENRFASLSFAIRGRLGRLGSLKGGRTSSSGGIRDRSGCSACRPARCSTDGVTGTREWSLCSMPPNPTHAPQCSLNEE